MTLGTGVTSGHQDTDLDFDCLEFGNIVKMFNTFLTNILNSYLGEIVEDLDLDNIGSGALNGDILLIDLKLRPDALVGKCSIIN